MPQQRVDIPGVGIVEFPDTMSRSEIDTASKRLHTESLGPMEWPPGEPSQRGPVSRAMDMDYRRPEVSPEARAMSEATAPDPRLPTPSDIAGGDMGAIPEPRRSAIQEGFNRERNIPIIPFGEMAEKMYPDLPDQGLAYDIERGFGIGINRLAAGFTTPTTIATVGAAMGAGLVSQTLKVLIGAGFTYEIAAGAIEQAPEIVTMVKEGRTSDAVAAGTEVAGSLLLAGSIGKHTFGAIKSHPWTTGRGMVLDPRGPGGAGRPQMEPRVFEEGAGLEVLPAHEGPLFPSRPTELQGTPATGQIAGAPETVGGRPPTVSTQGYHIGGEPAQVVPRGLLPEAPGYDIPGAGPGRRFRGGARMGAVPDAAVEPRVRGEETVVPTGRPQGLFGADPSNLARRQQMAPDFVGPMPEARVRPEPGQRLLGPGPDVALPPGGGPLVTQVQPGEPGGLEPFRQGDIVPQGRPGVPARVREPGRFPVREQGDPSSDLLTDAPEPQVRPEGPPPESTAVVPRKPTELSFEEAESQGKVKVVKAPRSRWDRGQQWYKENSMERDIIDEGGLKLDRTKQEQRDMIMPNERATRSDRGRNMFDPIRALDHEDGMTVDQMFEVLQSSNRLPGNWTQADFEAALTNRKPGSGGTFPMEAEADVFDKLDAANEAQRPADFAPEAPERLVPDLGQRMAPETRAAGQPPRTVEEAEADFQKGRQQIQAMRDEPGYAGTDFEALETENRTRRQQEIDRINPPKPTTRGPGFEPEVKKETFTGAELRKRGPAKTEIVDPTEPLNLRPKKPAKEEFPERVGMKEEPKVTPETGPDLDRIRGLKTKPAPKASFEPDVTPEGEKPWTEADVDTEVWHGKRKGTLYALEEGGKRGVINYEDRTQKELATSELTREPPASMQTIDVKPEPKVEPEGLAKTEKPGKVEGYEAELKDIESKKGAGNEYERLAALYGEVDVRGLNAADTERANLVVERVNERIAELDEPPMLDRTAEGEPIFKSLVSDDQIKADYLDMTLEEYKAARALEGTSGFKAGDTVYVGDRRGTVRSIEADGERGEVVLDLTETKPKETIELETSQLSREETPEFLERMGKETDKRQVEFDQRVADEKAGVEMDPRTGEAKVEPERKGQVEIVGQKGFERESKLADDKAKLEMLLSAKPTQTTAAGRKAIKDNAKRERLLRADIAEQERLLRNDPEQVGMFAEDEPPLFPGEPQVKPETTKEEKAGLFSEEEPQVEPEGKKAPAVPKEEKEGLFSEEPAADPTSRASDYVDSLQAAASKPGSPVTPELAGFAKAYLDWKRGPQTESAPRLAGAMAKSFRDLIDTLVESDKPRPKGPPGQSTLHANPIGFMMDVWSKNYGPRLAKYLMSTEKPYGLLVKPLPEPLKWLFLTRHRQPPEWVEAHQQWEWKTSEGRTESFKLGKEMSQGLSQADQLKLGELLRGEAKEADLRAMRDNPRWNEAIDAVKTARARFDSWGAQAAQQGLLKEETFFKNYGRYMPRLYRRWEVDYEGQLKQWNVSKPTRMDMDRWKKREDIPEEVRVMMGEIKEPGYPVAKGLSQIIHDVETAKLFNKVADHPDWTFDAEQLADLGKDPKQYTLMPESKALGRLSGKYVNKYIASVLNQMTKDRGQYHKVTRALVSEWKFNKVIFNPATHARNMVSNTMLAYLSGLPPWRVDIYGKAIRELYQQKGVHYEAAKAQGLFATTFAKGELGTLIDAWNQTNGGIYDRIAGMSEHFAKGEIAEGLGKVKPSSWKVGQKAAKIYQGEEAWFKLAKFIQETENGATPKAAAAAAQKALFDYTEVPPFVEWARTSPVGAPFITFTYKALPQIMETAITHPWRLGSIVAGIYAMEEGARQHLGVEEDQMALLKRIMPDRMRESPLGLGPRALLLPYKDKYGQLLYLDLTYLLPWGDVGEMGATGVLQGTPGYAGPLRAVAEIMLNKSGFTGNEIYGEHDTLKEKVQKISDYTYKFAAPSLAPGGYGFERLWASGMGIREGKADYFGRVSSPGTAVASAILGMKTNPISPQIELFFRKKDFTDAFDDLKGDAFRVRNHQGLSLEEKRKQLTAIQNKGKELRKVADEMFRGPMSERE